MFRQDFAIPWRSVASIFDNRFKSSEGRRSVEGEEGADRLDASESGRLQSAFSRWRERSLLGVLVERSDLAL